MFHSVSSSSQPVLEPVLSRQNERVIASLYKMPTSLVTYSDFCQEETFIKCRDYMKTFPIMNLSGTNQHSFYKMLSLRNVETPDAMQHKVFMK